MCEATKKFYSAKYDRVFKEVFLEPKNEDILKIILEKILKLKIEDIKVLNSEMNVGNIHVRRKLVDAILITSVGKIEIEVNSSVEDYVHPRNMAYISNIYTRHTLVGEDYTEDINIIQINLSYGISDKKAYRIYRVMDEDKKLFVKNFIIYEINMEYYLKLWYDKNEKEIEENKHIIMLGLEQEDLKELSKKDRVVKKFMNYVEVINNDVYFQEFMSKEEDERKIHNSRMKAATETGLKQGIEQGLKQGLKQGIEQEKIEIAKKMLNSNEDINKIKDYTGLSINEIEKLKN